MNRLPAQGEMYDALVRRDPEFDGLFLACVRTTGVFCRPTCRARKPRRENVEFVGTAQEALLAGYRPCRVCHPLDPRGGHPRWVRELFTLVSKPSNGRITDGLLRQRGMDPARARRYFKRNLGMTFHAYERAVRLGSAFGLLQKGRDQLSAGLESGYDSSSGFRTAFAKLFGDTPRRATDVAPLVASQIETPLRPMLAVASEAGLCLLEFLDRRALATEIALLRRHFGRAIIPGENRHIGQVRRELAEYFRGSRRWFDVPLDNPGTAFQTQVWNRLKKIPYGQTTSYGEIGAAIGSSSDRSGAGNGRSAGGGQIARAVGRAVGQNRIAIVVPCHRVLDADGALCGYAGGLWRKRWLLDLEQGGRAHSPSPRVGRDDGAVVAEPRARATGRS